MNPRILRVGIGGPVGSGKSMLIERVVPVLARRNYRVCIISNDVISKEDADRMRQNLATEQGLLPENMVIGIATGGCPHTAIREDPSINLSVIEQIESEHPDLDLIIIESGGDNITTTFSPALADYFIYIVDVSGGDKYPRKRGLGIETSDLLVINKIDLAPMVDADLDVMERDAKIVRINKPYVLVNCKTDQGIEDVAQHIIHDVLFDQPPKKQEKDEAELTEQDIEFFKNQKMGKLVRYGDRYALGGKGKLEYSTDSGVTTGSKKPTKKELIAGKFSGVKSSRTKRLLAQRKKRKEMSETQ